MLSMLANVGGRQLDGDGQHFRGSEGVLFQGFVADAGTFLNRHAIWPPEQLGCHGDRYALNRSVGTRTGKVEQAAPVDRRFAANVTNGDLGFTHLFKTHFARRAN